MGNYTPEFGKIRREKYNEYNKEYRKKYYQEHKEKFKKYYKDKKNRIIKEKILEMIDYLQEILKKENNE